MVSPRDLSVFDEVTDVNLRVTGSIPPSLSGRYLRTGSNPPSGVSAHWFAGDGMVHGVRLDAGNAVWYRNRYVQTTKFVRGLDATDPEVFADPTAGSGNTMCWPMPDGSGRWRSSTFRTS